MVKDIIIIALAIALVFTIICLRYSFDRLLRRKRKKEIIYSMIMDNSLLAAIMAAFLLAILFFYGWSFSKDDWKDLIDYKTLATVVLSFIIGILLMVLRRYLINRLEDSIKLTDDYDSLIKKYDAEKHWYKYDNSGAKAENFEKLTSKEKKCLFKSGEGQDNTVVFPVIKDENLKYLPISIVDSSTPYELDNEVSAYRDEVFKAHDTSHLYNQLNVRVKEWKKEWKEGKAQFVIYTERTTYFNSMVTNRALDYRLHNEMTLRDILQYGPFIPPLSESKLSNHLGINGFIISKDRYIPLVRRKGELSVAKYSYGPSVGASLKAKYCLDSEMRFSLPGLINGIKGEIKDELKIHIDGEATESVLDERNIIAAYRDIVEGNKTQLLFFFKTELNKADIVKNFKRAMAEKMKVGKLSSATEEQEEEDGNSFAWLSVDQLDEYIYLQNTIIANGKRYPSVPSTIASLLMLKDYLKKTES